MFAFLGHITKLFRIFWVLARHDAFFFLKGSKLYFLLKIFVKSNSTTAKNERLVNALESLGPVFIKLGQILSMRPDLLDDEVIKSLTKLQDNLPPFDSDIAVQIIEDNLGKPIDKLFKHFDKTPIAAASIAQVHKATTIDGEVVAVKVLRPNIKIQMENDIKFLYWLARLTSKFVKKSKRLKPEEIIKTLEKSVQFELDLRYEAASAAKMLEDSENHNFARYIKIPKIYWGYSSSDVLTLEWIEGVVINQKTLLEKNGHDLTKLVENATIGFFNMAFQAGFFHADLHAGNLLVMADGTLVAVDFGICGRLDLQERVYLAEIFHGFIIGDFTQVAKAHIDAGYVPYDTSVEEFALACRAIAQPILDKPLDEISGGNMLAQLFRVSDNFAMEMQPQLLMLQKSLILVEGIGRSLSPKSNLWDIAEQPIRIWAEENLTPKVKAKLFLGNIKKNLLYLNNLLQNMRGEQEK